MTKKRPAPVAPAVVAPVVVPAEGGAYDEQGQPLGQDDQGAPVAHGVQLRQARPAPVTAGDPPAPGGPEA